MCEHAAAALRMSVLMDGLYSWYATVDVPGMRLLTCLHEMRDDARCSLKRPEHHDHHVHVVSAA
jgi:hypothetical protein